MFTFFLKEIRQLRRDPVFWGALIVECIICASQIVLFKLGSAKGEGALFSHSYDNLGILAGVAVAIAMSMRWHGEINDDALNPVVTTPIPPASIAAGKYLATFPAVLIPLLAAQLFIGATVPKDWFDLYMKYRLPMNAAVLATASAFLLTVSPLRCKSGFLCSVLPGMLVIFFLVSTWLPQRDLLRAAARGYAQCPDMLYALAQILLPIPLLFAMTVAAISPTSSDRAVPVRFTLLFMLAAYLIVFWLENRKCDWWSSRELIRQAGELCFIGAIFSCLAAMMQRIAQSARVAAAIRRTPAVLRPLRVLCSTGALPELVFSALLAAAGAGLRERGAGSGMARTPLFVYLNILFAAAVTLLVAYAVEKAFRRRVAVWLRYVLFYAAAFGLSYVEYITDLHEDRLPMTILGIASAVLLIPPGIEFAKSLKRR